MKCVKGILFIYTVILSISGFLSQEAWGSKKAQTVINIGIYGPFTTERAFIGRHILAAMELGSEQIDSNSPIHYEFYTLDASVEAKRTAIVLGKFIKAHHLHILITEGNARGLIGARVAKANKIVHLGVANDAHVADGLYSFLAKSLRIAKDNKKIDPQFIVRFQENYFTTPTVESMDAYRVFQTLHIAMVASMKGRPTFSVGHFAQQVHKLVG